MPATSVDRALQEDTMNESESDTILDTASAGGPEVVAEGAPKKRKKKYSKGLRDLQRLERGLSRASLRLADAVSAGLRTYHQRSEASALERRDGAFRDSFENAAIATGKSLQVASRVPRDLARGVKTKWLWKRVRPLIKLAAKPIFSS